MDMWIVTRPEYEPLLVEARRARAASLAKALRYAGRSAWIGGRAAFRTVRSVSVGIARGLRRWRRRTVTRRELHRMSDHMLYDIGLSRGMIDNVASTLVDRSDRSARQAQTQTSPAQHADADRTYGLRRPFTVIRGLEHPAPIRTQMDALSC